MKFGASIGQHAALTCMCIRTMINPVEPHVVRECPPSVAYEDPAGTTICILKFIYRAAPSRLKLDGDYMEIDSPAR
jgi:hypothetical protein